MAAQTHHLRDGSHAVILLLKASAIIPRPGIAMTRDASLSCRVVQLGMTPYRQAWEMQERLAVRDRSGRAIPDPAAARASTHVHLRPPRPSGEPAVGRSHPRCPTGRGCVGRSGRRRHLPRTGAARRLSADPAGTHRQHRAPAPGGLRRFRPQSRAGARCGACPARIGQWAAGRVDGRLGSTGCRLPLPALPAGRPTEAGQNRRHRRQRSTPPASAGTVSPSMFHRRWTTGTGSLPADWSTIRSSLSSSFLDPAPTIDIVSREVTAAFGEVFGMQMVAEAGGDGPEGMSFTKSRGDAGR